MKTPISYYGGKQRLLKYILPLIPTHTLYAEPFTGGAAVFFAKEPADIEVLNDTNNSLITFYRIAQTRFRKLQRRVEQTLHSRIEHKKAQAIYKYPEFFSDIDIAWAIWYLVSTSFASTIGTGMSLDKSKQTVTRKLSVKREHFTKEIAKRLEHVHIENIDACKLIQSRDMPHTFFYCDPPYFNADMGHYKGYTEADFEQLLQTLSKIKGKFLLSSYPSELLNKYIQQNKWYTKAIDQPCSIGVGKHKIKTEILTANYPIVE
jgi:DNA adenine methylase